MKSPQSNEVWLRWSKQQKKQRFNRHNNHYNTRVLITIRRQQSCATKQKAEASHLLLLTAYITDSSVFLSPSTRTSTVSSATAPLQHSSLTNYVTELSCKVRRCKISEELYKLVFKFLRYRDKFHSISKTMNTDFKQRCIDLARQTYKLWRCVHLMQHSWHLSTIFCKSCILNAQSPIKDNPFDDRLKHLLTLSIWDSTSFRLNGEEIFYSTELLNFI